MVAKLSPSFCEQQAIAFATLHHELKQRLAEMDKHQPKASMTMVEGFKIGMGIHHSGVHRHEVKQEVEEESAQKKRNVGKRAEVASSVKKSSGKK